VTDTLQQGAQEHHTSQGLEILKIGRIELVKHVNATDRTLQLKFVTGKFILLIAMFDRLCA
jgi:hypothetical protein